MFLLIQYNILLLIHREGVGEKILTCISFSPHFQRIFFHLTNVGTLSRGQNRLGAFPSTWMSVSSNQIRERDRATKNH